MYPWVHDLSLRQARLEIQLWMLNCVCDCKLTHRAQKLPLYHEFLIIEELWQRTYNVHTVIEKGNICRHLNFHVKRIILAAE